MLYSRNTKVKYLTNQIYSSTVTNVLVLCYFLPLVDAATLDQGGSELQLNTQTAGGCNHS